MKVKNKVFIIIFSAILITYFFYKKSLGLNLFIFETFFFAYLSLTKQIQFKTKLQIVSVLGFIITAIFTIITHSTFSYIIHFITLFFLIGSLNFPKATSLINTFKVAFLTFFETQKKFTTTIFNTQIKGKKISAFLWKTKIFFIPLFIIAFFIFLYAASNPVFNDLVLDGIHFIQKGFIFIFKDLEFLVLVTFLIGIIFSNFLIFRSNKTIKKELMGSEFLKRTKKKRPNYFGILALKNEYKAAIFLFFTLNAILLLLNILDVYWVWFNFKWTGQFLKQFVHEGTYLLIFSIIVSIALVIYFFRGNLNFYKQNKILKMLAYLWIIQNAILTVSVGVRNFWYINYYSLAYKRIGVFIFLLLTLYGLYTVFVKIKDRKSSFYLYKSNAFAIYVLLVLCSIINWDSIIAKYNFNHYNTSYLHLEYLATLSNKSLPYLEKSLDELSEINKVQKDKFKRTTYAMTPLNYFKTIEKRKINFKNEWESKAFLEWNLAEYLAYNKLFSK